MWLKHGRTGVIVQVTDPVHIARLLTEEKSVEVSGPDADAPPLTPSEAEAREALTRLTAAQVRKKTKKDFGDGSS